MTEQIRFRLGSEVLTRSALHDALWPPFDPKEAVQPVAEWSEADSALLDDALSNTTFRWPSFQTQTAGMTVPEKIWQLLTHRAFNFNGVLRVRAEQFWLERIKHSVECGETISLVYPLICKINNPAKRLTIVGVTAGERAIVRFFANLGRLVQEFYSPGLCVRILSDATLYNNALQVPPPSAYAYMDEIRRLISDEDAAAFVELIDYSALLAPYYRQFEELYNRHYQTLQKTPGDFEDLGALPTSVRASINTSRLGLPYDTLQRLFGPAQVGFSSVRHDLDAMTLYALQEQLAIKWACNELDLPSLIWPNSVRASCHRGLKNGRAVLGLRMYPEYYAASRLLPYHGMPLIDADSSGRPRLVILPEICLRGEEALTRVVNQHGEPVLYRQDR